MDRFEIIEQLEGRYAPNLQGNYRLIKNGHFVSQYWAYNLLQYNTGQLEIMLRDSMSYNEYRRKLLHKPVRPVIGKKALVFAAGKNSFEVRALAMLTRMQPDERTRTLGEMLEAADYVSQRQNEDYDRVAGNY